MKKILMISAMIIASPAFAGALGLAELFGIRVGGDASGDAPFCTLTGVGSQKVICFETERDRSLYVLEHEEEVLKMWNELQECKDQLKAASKQRSAELENEDYLPEGE